MLAASPDPEISRSITEALRGSRHLVVLTGAGISAESGLPTFRDPLTGLWARYRAEDLATPGAFRANPRLVWDWYAWRRCQAAQAEPNDGHRALCEMERRLPRFTLLTQNVDGLHRRAGSRNLVELHGSLEQMKCFDNGHRVESWPEEPEGPPPCPRCGSPIRPDVVWFGEPLPQGAWQAAFAAAGECDLFFSVGTSGLVQPAASLPHRAKAGGARVVTINPGEVAGSGATDDWLRGPAGRILPALVEAAWPRETSC